MSALRRLSFFRRPELYLTIVLAVLALSALDTLRAPQNQATARMYIAAIHGYQRWGHSLTAPFVRCPYRPTCSEYSRQAVEKFGVRRGLALTMSRLARCRGGVRPGTPDPIP